LAACLTITVYGGAAGSDAAIGEIGGNKILVETSEPRTWLLDFGLGFGGIRVSDVWMTAPVRARSAQADLVVLYAMLTWAVTVRVGGCRLLVSNPLAGVRRPHEPNPQRPVATWDRFAATRKAMQELQREAAVRREAKDQPVLSEWEEARWIKMELALVLAEATGRRLGSIRQLRWADIDLAAGTIHWRAESDKKGKEWTVPIPLALVDDLKDFRNRLGTIGGWLFRGERKPDQPMDRHLFDRWLAYAERKAKLVKLAGGLWHPYRRKWATERKHLPIPDVAAAGGWLDAETLLACYQQPTNDALLAVMSEERKVRDVAIVRPAAAGA
jgi:integrase